MQAIVEKLSVKHEQLEKDFHGFEDEAKLEMKNMQNRISALETRTTVNERDIKSVLERLTKIDNNTTWILRLLIGAFATSTIGGVIGLFFWLLQGSLGGN